MTITRVLLLLTLCCAALAATAQRPFMQDIWLNENRTPLKANVLLIDDRGYLLVGTGQGLFRYNGTTFKSTKSRMQAPVTALAHDKGKVWVGYKDGRIGYLATYDSIAEYLPQQYKPEAAVTDICPRGDGSLWLGTEAGLVHIQQGKASLLGRSAGLSDDFVYQLVFRDEQHLLVGTDQGINTLSFEGGAPRIRTYSSDQGLQDNIVRVIAATGEAGQYWIGAQQGGLSLFDSKAAQCRRLKVAGGWQWGQVNDILPVPGKRLWVATDEGYLLELTRLGNDSARVNSFAHPDKKINDLVLDKSGNIWCATTKGISLVTAEFLDYFSLSTPYSLTEVSAMCCDRDNLLWLALKNDLYCIDLGDEIKMPRKVFHAIEPVSALFCDRDNTLWMGTSGDGLWRKEGGSESFEKVPVEPGTENVLSIAISDKTLWVSGLNGVREFEMLPGGLRPVRTHDKIAGIGSDYIYQLYPDSRQRLWMATDGAGVCLLHNGEYQHWNIFKSANSTVAYTLTEDAAGAIWAGTLYKDLFRYTGGQWENIRRKEVQDIDVNLSTVNANATGQVIAVYQRCIDLWYPGSRFFRHFNSRHGMGMDSTSRVLNCSARDTAGNVYVPFEKGMLVFKNQSTVYDIRPDVHILRVSNNLKAVPEGQTAFGPDENYLSFYFDGISYTNPERLNYRFRLEGYSDNWVYTNDPVATFPKLPSGTFTFRVEASLNGGFDNASEAAYTFTIAAPLWRRPWFLVIAGITLIAVVYALIRFRDRKMQRLALLEQERILFDYEHLKGQVNPHFLFNSLNTLTNLIEESPESAVRYTEQLSDLYRNMLTYHNRELITLGEELRLLSAYLYIQESRFGQALQFRQEIPEALKTRRKIPPMALQLLVENAIKHNVVSASLPLVVEISATEDELTVRNEIHPKIKKEPQSGIGLANISNRYTLLTQKKVYFGQEGNYWIVRLPLL
ncbi:sensor histidine kinase [Taibaiella koreensis]|uniref:sensor histidine kinase n=1 Tax=Taibaiella koreensis TaxID=1268548 RepID=UPI000E599CE0|nr:sensor histidine kinase [Taibaiella koreensis]